MKSGRRHLKNNNIKIVNLGIIGCGSVSEMYLDFLSSRKDICLYSCSDINFGLCKAAKKKYGIKKAVTVSEMLADREVDVILNLTDPLSHFRINYDVLKNKKHLFSEKPYALSAKEADLILELAKRNKVLFYSAPDTYLSRAYQSVKNFIANGGIGKPISVNVVSTCRPVENWHPNPGFFYKRGAGPLFDRGVYYLTALVFFFGKIKSVGCYSGNYVPIRTYKRGALRKKILVESLTHYSIIIKLQHGETATLMFSFDTFPNPDSTDIMTIFGTSGVIDVPTPMEYGGAARAYDVFLKKWKDIKQRKKCGYYLNGDLRGVGVIEMINDLKGSGLRYDNATIANNVIKVMEAIEKSGKLNKIINVK